MWHLRCLGRFRAVRVGTETGCSGGTEQIVERFRTQKTAALLALLALRGAKRREEVAVLLWPDAAAKASRASLSSALSSVRRELGASVLVADRHSIRLAPGAVVTDVALFDAALEERNWERAVELYRDHLLRGFCSEPFPTLAEEYEEKALVAFSRRLQVLEEAHSRIDERRALARRAVLLFGADERWFVALMRAELDALEPEVGLQAYEALQRSTRRRGGITSQTARSLAKELRRQKERLAARSFTLPASAQAKRAVRPTSALSESAYRVFQKPASLVETPRWGV